MRLSLVPAPLRGTVTPPPSKSQAHRLLLAAALAAGESAIANVALSQDIEATLRCLEALGAAWRRQGTGVAVRGMGGRTGSGPLPRFDCGESDSTLRFLIPIALAAAGGGVFTGRGRLMERPQGPYEAMCREKHILFEQKDGVLTVRGVLTPGTYRLAGNVSSQFFTGLFFALPLLPGDSRVEPATALESAAYLDITRSVQAAFGVTVGPLEGGGFAVPGNQTYHPRSCAAEADWSQAAFWYAAAALGSRVTVAGMDRTSLQGDRAILELLDLLAGGGERRIDVSQIPDLVPPLAALAAGRDGATRLENAGRLRIKESDRLATVRRTLSAFGVEAEEGADCLTIYGRSRFRGGVIDCCGDHRIAMLAAVLATRAEGPVELEGAECVRKSYPDFWEEYQRLGGEIHVL